MKSLQEDTECGGISWFFAVYRRTLPWSKITTKFLAQEKVVFILLSFKKPNCLVWRNAVTHPATPFNFHQTQFIFFITFRLDWDVEEFPRSSHDFLHLTFMKEITLFYFSPAMIFCSQNCFLLCWTIFVFTWNEIICLWSLSFF